MAKTVLITGATGFVGRPLCDEMIRRQWRVKVALRSRDYFSADMEPVIVGAIDGRTDWVNTLNDVDVVIHLAARVHVMKDNAADPMAEFLGVNLYATMNLARQAVLAGVKRLIYVSSIKVNGERTDKIQPFTEKDNCNPQDGYAKSKWEAEQALHHIAAETGLEIVIVRPPLVYGPGVKGNFLKLINAIDKGIPLPLAAAGNMRNVVYVGNLADALAACASHSIAAGKTYLISDGEGISTKALIGKIAQSLGRDSCAFYCPPALVRAAGVLLGRSDQVDRLFDSLCINDQKIRSELAWMPPYTMEQGLRATAVWYRSRHSR